MLSAGLRWAATGSSESTAPGVVPTSTLRVVVASSVPGRPVANPAATSRAIPCALGVSLLYSEACRSAQPLSAATALMRGSRAAASRLVPAPEEMPETPMRAGSARVLSSAQSISALTSSTVAGPAMSMLPPDSQKPREL
ncbi:hypothetical protein G6F32_015216 [Rhizopus arrhizus]|nr:hypothetical protein G6F32_015216 [Rhizopus arrhizus]